ncbi:uncharacterized protein LY79DRAFT_537495 [Colletotrichum navitas]|uniref:Uncharacterized protein n=1 Tax=Colletotrichum navitas TaxID=681940 RepID=A0AAD8VAX3_9PEZI|nr:uncharacterized protein LY79DRAFT_537495 [Colletotrichum navitas]KAK1598563.1 hypothetical protein LY79DRAFT_537495 [Colletotrichum navitas]
MDAISNPFRPLVCPWRECVLRGRCRGGGGAEASVARSISCEWGSGEGGSRCQLRRAYVRKCMNCRTTHRWTRWLRSPLWPEGRFPVLTLVWRTMQSNGNERYCMRWLAWMMAPLYFFMSRAACHVLCTRAVCHDGLFPHTTPSRGGAMLLLCNAEDHIIKCVPYLVIFFL